MPLRQRVQQQQLVRTVPLKELTQYAKNASAAAAAAATSTTQIKNAISATAAEYNAALLTIQAAATSDQKAAASRIASNVAQLKSV